MKPGLADGGPNAAGSRAHFVDLLRGLVIVLMVLDHSREYFHDQALLFDATNLSSTTAPLFATRWLTHLCAPTFVFLSGVSIRLQQLSGKARLNLSRYLLLRGLWLIVLELTVVAFGFNFAAPFVFLQVIWAIGAGMVVMAALVWIPRPALLPAALLLLAVAYQGARLPVEGAVWQLLFVPGPSPLGSGLAVYPVIPWFAIMLFGFATGGPDAGSRLEARESFALWCRDRNCLAPVTMYYVVTPPRQSGIRYDEEKAPDAMRKRPAWRWPRCRFQGGCSPVSTV